jgi:hypothetical protein
MKRVRVMERSLGIVKRLRPKPGGRHLELQYGHFRFFVNVSDIIADIDSFNAIYIQGFRV